VLILGVGNVGLGLARELHQRGARLFVADVAPERVKAAVDAYGATPLPIDALLSTEAEFFAPCALGGAINDSTVAQLKVKAVTGAANNQLFEPRHGEELAKRGILYAPDYAINAGGLINVAQEVAGFDRAEAVQRAGKIFDTLTTVFTRARAEKLRPEQVADQMAEEWVARG
jgi:leucine dehydrogenase